jgi:HNH endonuclease.
MGIYGKGAKGRCDKLVSQIVRSAGKCQRCGSVDTLQCAHIISRKYSATRTDLRNLWVLCARCHRRLTDWPREHSRYITETIGSTKYEELRDKAEQVTKMDWDAEYERLKAVAKEMGVL